LKKLVKELSKECTLGLVTGCPKKIAKVVLEKVKLWDYFKFGAFGDEGKDRTVLLKLATKRANVKVREKFVFDDSVRGIKLANELGFTTIATVTGPESEQQLRAVNPNFLFQNLSNTKKILNIILTK